MVLRLLLVNLVVLVLEQRLVFALVQLFLVYLIVQHHVKRQLVQIVVQLEVVVYPERLVVFFQVRHLRYFDVLLLDLIIRECKRIFVHLVVIALVQLALQEHCEVTREIK